MTDEHRNPLLDDDDEDEYVLPPASETKTPDEETQLEEEIPLSLPALEPKKKEPVLPEPPQAPTVIEDELSSLLGDLMGEEEEFTEPTIAPISEEELAGLKDGQNEDALEVLNRLVESGYKGTGKATLGDFFSPLDDETEDYRVHHLDLDAVIDRAIAMDASDIHLAPFDEVAFTILGEIKRMPEFGVLDPDMTIYLQQDIISNVLEQMFVEDLELDTSYVVQHGPNKGRRLRLSVGKTEGNVFMVFRIIAKVMPTPDQLEIPRAMRDWVNLPNGLVLVNGPTGSGKSTTLSSLIQEIQFTRAEKVITIEKPIEYVYGVKEGQKAYITQREVGKDARTFAAALTSAMRQAPNIIMVGEVRNREEIDELLRAAETGHLAISTMHTTSCPATINRIRSMYQGDEQLRVLATLSDNLRGMMTQTLVKSPDGKSRTAVREVLQVDNEIKAYVLQGDVQGIRNYQEERKITMEHELVRAVQSGKASLESARAKSPNPLYFDQLLK